MECSQQQTRVAATVTLYENFLEEKCESDLLIPDYYPSAEKIIQCSATPFITRKEVEGDRLILEGNCRICVIYQGEEESGIRSLNETVVFNESLLLKEVGENPWVQIVVRSSGVSCRLLNPRKISVRANVSVAIKVKDQQTADTIEKMDCDEVEALFLPSSVYTILEHSADTIKVQGDIEVHNEIQDILKTDGSICIKDARVMAGKAMVKGVVSLIVLYTSAAAPERIESVSTSIPFSQMLELRQSDGRGQMDAVSYIQNIRTDVESDENGNNRLISISATVLTEGEIFENQTHQMLLDVYSNQHPIKAHAEPLIYEEMRERLDGVETIHHKIPMEAQGLEIVQAMGNPVIQKISGKDQVLKIDGVMDASIFLKDGERYRSLDKSFSFALNVPLQQLDGQMRCEVHPCVLGMSWSVASDGLDLKVDLGYNLVTFSRHKLEVIQQIEVDTDHQLEKEPIKPLVVYYGEKGERLWDIARRYATSVTTLKALNNLAADVLDEKKLLLISKA